MTELPLLLDTHVWIWMENDNPRRISPAAERRIAQAESSASILISAVSLWELAMLDARGRIEVVPDALSWMRRSLALPGRVLVPLSPEITVTSVQIPDPPVADPMDLMLLATALVERAELMTADRKLLEYGKRHRLRIVPA